MKTEWMECVIPFSDGSESYKVGDDVLVLPAFNTQTHYCVGTDYHVPVMVEKKYLKAK